MDENKPIVLNRDCDAILIPVGTPLTLSEGTTVLITQALGGSYTVNVNGNLARIDAKNADELNKLFFKLRDEFGQTFLIVTHNEKLSKISDKILKLVDGKIQTR